MKLQIEEPGGREYPLAECGDGLRDLIGIVYCAVTSPHADLFLDEPGIRLHPRAQRRLLGFLKAESSRRAVWIATHDPVFMGEANVSARYFCRRNRRHSYTQVEKIGGREELRAVYSELGWKPADALLAESVLLVEGPSDRVAFERVLFFEGVSGCVVAELGGCGQIWNKSFSGLGQLLARLRAVAPYAVFRVLIDSDARTDAEKQAARRAAEKHSVDIRFLRMRELEDYWLTPRVLPVLVSAAAARTSMEQDQRDLMVLSEREAEELLASRGDAQSSRWLAHLLFERWSLRFDKVAVAEIGIAALRELEPEKYARLAQEVTEFGAAEGPMQSSSGR